MRSSRPVLLLGLLLTQVGLPAPLTAQDPPCRDCIRIEIDAGDGTMRRYSFWGTGTHRYAKGPGEVSKDAPKSGAFENGIYTCWDPRGWKHVEIGFDEGVKLTTFDAAGKPVLNLRSQGLQDNFHVSGRRSFGARRGAFQFWNVDGSMAADVRLCQDIWRRWGTDIEVDEHDVWQELLYDMHARKLLPRLVAAVEHGDPWVRAHACAALDTLGRDAAAAVPALRRVLVGDPFWLVRQRAAQALWDLGPLAREAVPELVRVVSNRDEDSTTREFAVRALGDIGDRAAVSVPALEAAAKLGPPSLQVEITAALGWIDPADRKTVQQLASRLADPEGALAAAFSLYYRYRGIAQVAREAVQRELDKQGEAMTDLSSQLSVLLYHLDPAARQPAWAEGSNSSSSFLPVRSLAPVTLFTFCMLDADPDEIGDAISSLAECPNTYYRDRLLDYPAELGPEVRAAVPGLVHLLSVISSDTNEWAARALSHIGPAAIPALAAALQPRGEKRSPPWCALDALAAIGEPAIPALTEILQHREEWLCIGAAKALGRIGPAARTAVPALQLALLEPGTELRAAAALAIARIEGAAVRSPRQAKAR